MKKKVFAMLLCGLPLMINAQAAFDVLQMSQTELRGTSRFQSMAGAFGALGGDLSTLTQNPAGIGVYRNSDLGITMSLDFNSTAAGTKPDQTTTKETKFNVNNVGYVGVIRLDSETVPNLNFGFTYNRLNSFNRHYTGGVGFIPTSMSNFIAKRFVNENPYGPYSVSDLWWDDDPDHYFNPYFDYNLDPYTGKYRGYAPWAAVTIFDMPTNGGGYVGIMNADENDRVKGLFQDGTEGDAYYEVDERGHVDEYNIAFGGNIANKVYFGLDFGIVDLDYRSFQGYEEELDNAYIMADDEDLFTSPIIHNNTYVNWGLYNYLHSEGTGVNFKLGLIWKPIQQLRIGAAVHTPTYYDMRDTYYVCANMDAYQNGNHLYSADKGSNDGYDYSTTYTIKTPWHFLGSVAGVIGTKGVLSLDYEYVANETMRIGDDRNNDDADITNDVKNYFKPSHIIRVGGEYRVNPSWSLRAGYSIKTSQVENAVNDYDCEVSTVGSNPTYQYDNTVHNITCGVGYRYKSFYADLAYVHKIRNSVYNAFSPIDDKFEYVPNVSAEVKDNNNRASLTLGFRF